MDALRSAGDDGRPIPAQELAPGAALPPVDQVRGAVLVRDKMVTGILGQSGGLEPSARVQALGSVLARPPHERHRRELVALAHERVERVDLGPQPSLRCIRRRRLRFRCDHHERAATGSAGCAEARAAIKAT